MASCPWGIIHSPDPAHPEGQRRGVHLTPCLSVTHHYISSRAFGACVRMCVCECMFVCLLLYIHYTSGLIPWCFIAGNQALLLSSPILSLSPTSNPIHLLNFFCFHKYTYTYVHMILCVHKICGWVGQLWSQFMMTSGSVMWIAYCPSLTLDSVRSV